MKISVNFQSWINVNRVSNNRAPRNNGPLVSNVKKVPNVSKNIKFRQLKKKTSAQRVTVELYLKVKLSNEKVHVLQRDIMGREEGCEGYTPGNVACG